MSLDGELRSFLGVDRVLTRRIDRLAFANDASVYRLVPRAVVFPESIAELQELFRFSRARRLPLTFRAAGTSLSGQAVTDGILVVVSRHWRGLEILERGRKVRVQPGVIGGAVNRALRCHGSKIGPDPASIDACMIGGILANNSSGMCCGVEQNAYRTLESMRFVLPDGLVVDSSLPDADDRLRREAPAVAEGVSRIKAKIEASSELRERIRYKYGMKNTTGYSLNALLDFDSPVDILSHLMIGSEGTLGFIAEAVLRTVPDYRYKYTGLLLFANVPHACAAIGALRDSGARALELMDHASLRAIAGQTGVPAAIGKLPIGAAALLVEYQREEESELETDRHSLREIVPALPLLHPADFTRDPVRQAALWRVRKGLIPSVGAVRSRGTSFILEDVVFPLPRLAAGVTDLQQLFREHGYDDAIVFGHAKDGNLHFVLIQAFDRPDEVERYDRFMQSLADLVVKRYDGALKAEHGTGRNMAPFVATEWGSEAYALMRELKQLLDPDGLLNPGVVLNDDPRAHVTDLKELNAVEQEVDQCIECGFCERLCPSRDLTLTPRQRIVVRREMARLRRIDPRSPELAELESDYRYAGIDTCAADGMCALACPVGIDTGSLVKRLRFEAHSESREELVTVLAGRFDWLERVARIGLRVARPWLSRRLGLPPAAKWRRPFTHRTEAEAIYFPSCVSRVVGPDGGSGVVAELVAVAKRAGRPVFIPEDVGGLCCGMAFSSKGYRRAAALCRDRGLERMAEWTRGGELPVVVDTSPCAMTLKEAAAEFRGARLAILDGVEFAQRLLAAGLRPTRRKRRIALQPTCSLHRSGLVDVLQAVGRACADETAMPPGEGCCGFAGDRGFLRPELTEAALAPWAALLRGQQLDGAYGTSRTCEIGLHRATGLPVRSIWSLLDEVTR